MPARGSPLLIAWLVFSALIALPASACGQSSDQTANQSTIFPSLGHEGKTRCRGLARTRCEANQSHAQNHLRAARAAVGVPLAQPSPRPAARHSRRATGSASATRRLIPTVPARRRMLPAVRPTVGSSHSRLLRHLRTGPPIVVHAFSLPHLRRSSRLARVSRALDQSTL